MSAPATAISHAARVWAGLKRLSEGRADEAEAILREAFAARPDDPWVLNGLGGVALLRRDTATAERLIGAAARLLPGEPEILANLAALHTECDRLDDAETCLDEAVRLAPRHAGIRERRAELFLARRRPSEAVDEAQQALECDPERPRAWLLRGLCALAASDRPLAIACFDEAVALDEACIEAWHNLAEAHASLGDEAVAIDCAERAYLCAPSDPVHIVTLARLLAARDPGRSGDLIRRALALAPGLLPALELQALTATDDATVRQAFAALAAAAREDVYKRQPKPFAEMPLVPERCFGGQNHPLNPLGRGMEAARRVDLGEIVLLPNIERADRLIRTAEDAPEPVRLGPIDPAHPSRRALAGTYDDHWLKHGFPGLAADADPRLFCVATPDQRVEGYFSGQEPYRLTGFSAEHPVIEGALPGMRVRIFIARSDGLFELPNVLDTAWLFPSAHKGVLVYRGACPVADIDGDDVTHVMLAYERLADEPRPVEHYAEAFRLRSDPAEKPKYVLADAALSPLPDPAALERRRLARIAHHERQRERTEKAQRLVLRDALDKAGLPAAFMPNLPPAEPPPAWMPSPEEIASGEIDFAALFEGTQQLQAQMDERGCELEAQAHAMAKRGERFRQTGELGELDALLAELDLPEQPNLAATALPPDFKLPASTVDPEAAFREALQRFHSGLGAALLAPARDGLAGAQAAKRDDLVPQGTTGDKGRRQAIQLPAQADAASDKLRRAFPDLAPPGQSLDELLGTLLAGDILPASAAPADPKAQLARASAQLDQLEPQLGEAMATMRRAAPQPIHPITPLPPEAARRFGRAIVAAKAEGLAGRDMAGADLSGQDFSGLELSGAFFEQCDLRNARFVGANCTGAVFAGADLRGADFSQANLLEANFGTADARGARFAGADLRRAQWLKSQVAQGDFAGAQLEQANFIETDLSDVSFAGARLDRVTILRSGMARVVLVDAVMESCALVEIRAEGLDARRLKAFKLSAVKLEAPGADFSGAHLQQSGFHAGCDLTGARFDGAVGMNGSFRGARLIRASFARASFNRVDFGEADLSEADLALASLKQASLGKAILLRADLFGANLFNAQARRARLDGARLLRANLYGCDLSDASLVGADLTQALVDKTLFGMPADAP